MHKDSHSFSVVAFLEKMKGNLLEGWNKEIISKTEGFKSVKT
jgi:hypothetical protein